MLTSTLEESPPAQARWGEVVILAYTYPPEKAVGGLRPFRFAKYLPAYGLATHVVTAARQESGAAPNVHYVRDWAQEQRGFPGRVARKLLRTVYPEGGEESSGWTPAARAAADRIIASAPGPYYILSTFPPLSTHLTALWLKKLHGNRLKWVADFRDPLTCNSSVLKRASFWNSRVEPLIFQRADHLIANTDIAAERWRGRYPQCAHKISHIWNGYDPEEELKPLPIPPRQYKSIAHIGDIYGGRHPHQLLASLNRLLKAGVPSAARARVELIGDLDWQSIRDPELLNSLVQQGTVVLASPHWSPPENRRAMASADALVVIDWLSGCQVPSKLYVYLRIGRPILAITSKGAPVDRILSRGGVPYVCLYPEDSSEESDAKVLRFLDLPSDPVTASDWFFHEFDGKRQAGALATILKALPAARETV